MAAKMAKYYNEEIRELIRESIKSKSAGNKKSDFGKFSTDVGLKEKYYKGNNGWEISESPNDKIVEDKSSKNSILNHLFIYDITTKLVLLGTELLGSVIKNVYKGIRNLEAKPANIQLNKLEEVKSAIKTK